MGAKPGDRIFVSGTIGDAALGLRLRRDAALADPKVAADFGRWRNLARERAEIENAFIDKITTAMVNIVKTGLAAPSGHAAEISSTFFSER